MEKKAQISASDLASILAIWAVALIGCKNVVSSTLEKYLPQYFSELLKPDSPTFGISTPVQHCILATIGTSFLLFFCYDIFINKFNKIDSFLTQKLNNSHVKEILFVIISFIIMFLKETVNKDYSHFFILCLFIYIYTSNRFLFAAKIALVPALVLIMFAYVLPEKVKNREPYMVSTTCEGLEEIKVISAIRIGNFVELTTETDPVLLNINAITRIREIKKSPEDAAKAPQPAAQE